MGAFSLVFSLVAMTCHTPKEVVQQPQETLESADSLVQHSGNPVYIVTDSIQLAVEAFSVVDNMAKGIKTRGEPSCVFLNIKGLKVEGDVDVSFDVFINKKDADPETGIESPNYVDTVSLGPAIKTQDSFDLKIDLNKAIENLGESLVEDLGSGKLYVTMVAFPYSGNLEDLKRVNFSVDSFSLSIICD